MYFAFCIIKICGCGGIGRRTRFRFWRETVGVQVSSPAPSIYAWDKTSSVHILILNQTKSIIANARFLWKRRLFLKNDSPNHFSLRKSFARTNYMLGINNSSEHIFILNQTKSIIAFCNMFGIKYIYYVSSFF